MRAFMCLGIVALAVMVACGGSSAPSASQACNEGASALCERLYACFTAAELQAAGYPATESACVTMTQTTDGCSAKTNANFCTGSNQVFHPDQVDGCLSQIMGLQCADVRSTNFDVNVSAPTCAKVCAVP
jgi:hypothetical protein